MTNFKAVGDLKGNLVLLSLPINLYKPSSNEKETMKEFWEREKNRVIYVRERFLARQEEEKEYE